MAERLHVAGRNGAAGQPAKVAGRRVVGGRLYMAGWRVVAQQL